MANEKTRTPKRFTIGIGGGHREYNMNGITYVSSWPRVPSSWLLYGAVFSGA